MLVADEKSVRLISSIMKMADLMEFGVSAIEKLELKRKPFREMHAIYLISPTDKSLDLLAQDFGDKKKPQYGAAHVFITNRIPEFMMQRIADSETLLQSIKTFKEINQDFICNMDNNFSLDMP